MKVTSPLLCSVGSYCTPLEAGLASETRSVCRRLARLLQGFDEEINSCIVEGKILDDLRECRIKIMESLKRDGWTWSYQGSNRLTVRQPGHKKPFKMS